MATKAGVGMSRHHNPNVAGREAAEQALKKAGVSKPDFVLMFGSIGYDQRSLVRAVRVATAISSEQLRWRNGLVTVLSANPRAVGKLLTIYLLHDLSAGSITLCVPP